VARPEIGKAKRIHPYAWLWEPLEPEPSFVLRSMFGTKAAYLEGKLVLCFSSGKEPWNGLLVATDRERQAPLVAEFPGLKPHPILPKWLYLSDSSDAFEPTAERLVELARQRDPRIGVFPQERKRKGRSAGPA
jgi:hypothetical protein